MKKRTKPASQLTIRDVPEDMYWWIHNRAKSNQRTMGRELLVLLDKLYQRDTQQPPPPPKANATEL